MSDPEANVDPDDTLRLLRDLVRIDSVNPRLVEGAAGEAEVAAHVAGELRDAGLEVETREATPGRVSVVGRLRGDLGAGPSFMLNAHTDTVGVEDMEDPFSAELRDGRVYGRGAYDMKGGLAACIEAAKALARAGAPFPGELVVAAVADEEHSSVGTADVLTEYSADAAVVTEPTGLELCTAHKGFAWMEVRTEGRAAHGSQFEVGRDANMRMGRVLSRLEELEREVRSRDPHPLLGPPSLHAPLLRGGTGISTYADRCTLRIERRTVPGETGEQVAGEVEAILDDLREASDFEASLETLLVRSPFEVDGDAGVVRALEDASERVLGRTPEHVGENPWMDSALLADAGIETAVLGPRGAGAHAEEEWVEVESVIDLARILSVAAADYLAGD
ncbi:MAG: ArgE/DapE family deacylase [Candidatus Palauibacterales bacterium]|nr:ArgE/DapE family deacylase [Candidatus Palauibacterales bacterium]